MGRIGMYGRPFSDTGKAIYQDRGRFGENTSPLDWLLAYGGDFAPSLRDDSRTVPLLDSSTLNAVGVFLYLVPANYFPRSFHNG